MKTVLTTERLVLGEVTQDDYADVFEMLNHPEIEEYASPGVRGPEGAQSWLSRSRDRYSRHGHGLWATRLRSSNVFVGMIGILNHEMPEVSSLEVGWHLKKAHWRQGYAREAAAACLEYGFSTLKQSHLVSLIRPTNAASIRVATSLGMVHEKTLYIEKFKRETAVYGISKTSSSVRRP